MTSGTPTAIGGHPDEAAISAYLDGELPTAERGRLEAHLAECAACRRTLRSYRLLGAALRQGTVPVPPRLAHDLRARLRDKPARRRLRLLPAIGSLAAGLVFLFLIGSLASMSSGTAVANAYPVPNATDVPLTVVVEIAYTAGVDRQAAESAVIIDPPVPVEKQWHGDTLVVKPVQPLAPETHYTVRALDRAPSSPPLPVPALPVLNQPADATPTPGVVTTFRTAPAAVAAAPTQAAAAAQTAQAPAVALASPASGQAAARPAALPTAPSPTPTPMPTAQVVAAAETTPVREPVRGFGALYKGNSAVRAGLGRPLADEQAVQLAEAVFERGIVLWRGDERITYVLATDGRWTSPSALASTAPSTPTVEPLAETVDVLQATPKTGRLHESVRTALGRELEPERIFTGAVQAFTRGTMIWSDERIIYVLYTNGRWEQHHDEFTEDTPTPTPTATPGPPTIPTVKAPPATPPAAEPTPTPAAAAAADCAFVPVRGFGRLYAMHAELRRQLACPLEAERPIQAAEQTFEGGKMLWRGDKRVIYVLIDEGAWFAFEDTYEEGVELTAETPPSGLLAPIRGFGKLWREQTDVRRAVGWATAPERGFTGAVEAFGGGTLIWSDAKRIFALYADGRWEAFADDYVE